MSFSTDPTSDGQDWRVLLDGAATGAWNMAVDEALFASVADGGPPTLRLYAWSAPTLSLGLSQRRPDPGLLDACDAAGVEVVRRVTGGRAVLHGSDLTYAVVAPERRLPRGLEASYAWVSRALVAALRELGVDARAVSVSPEAPAAFDCFAAPATHEIAVGARKLVGSAQRRGAGAVLQHGSIRLRPDAPAIRRAVGLESGVATSLAEEGHSIGAERLTQALLGAFASSGVRPEGQGSLTPDEGRTATARARNRIRNRLFAELPHPGISPGEPQGSLSATDR